MPQTALKCQKQRLSFMKWIPGLGLYVFVIWHWFLWMFFVSQLKWCVDICLGLPLSLTQTFKMYRRSEKGRFNLFECLWASWICSNVCVAFSSHAFELFKLDYYKWGLLILKYPTLLAHHRVLWNSDYDEKQGVDIATKRKVWALCRPT